MNFIVSKGWKWGGAVFPGIGKNNGKLFQGLEK
jgi:hypothetical protein